MKSPTPFQSFPFLFEDDTAVMDTQHRPRERQRGRKRGRHSFFSFSLRNERNVRWHPVSESFAVPLTNGSGFSDDWAIVFGWAGFHPHFRRPFAMAVAYCFLLLLLFSSFLLSRLAPAWSGTKRSEAKRAEWLWWRERCVYNRVCSCMLFQGARLRGNLRTAYCMRAGVGGIESVVERGRDELSRVECCRNRWGSYYSFLLSRRKGITTAMMETVHLPSYKVLHSKGVHPPLLCVHTNKGQNSTPALSTRCKRSCGERVEKQCGCDGEAMNLTHPHSTHKREGKIPI